MASSQELFANGLAAYQKVIEANYMAHRAPVGLERPDWGEAELMRPVRRSPASGAEPTITSKAFQMQFGYQVSDFVH